MRIVLVCVETLRKLAHYTWMQRKTLHRCNTFVLSAMIILQQSFQMYKWIIIQLVHYFKLFDILRFLRKILVCYSSCTRRFSSLYPPRLIAENVETLLQQSRIGQDQKACKTKWEHPYRLICTFWFNPLSFTPTSDYNLSWCPQATCKSGSGILQTRRWWYCAWSCLVTAKNKAEEHLHFNSLDPQLS